MFHECSNVIRVPGEQDIVYKDQCVLSFHSPESEGGVFVCMKTFLGFSQKYALSYCTKNPSALFLRCKTQRYLLPELSESANSTPTELALGTKTGFSLEASRYEFEDSFAIAKFADGALKEYPLPIADLDPTVQKCVDALIAAPSASRRAELESMARTWEKDGAVISKFAVGLKQNDNPRHVSSNQSNWKCDMCDMTTNLWLNLTDGSILCGRKFYDGSGGNNHAVDHYETCKHPLAVKLGTILPDGTADVFSYPEGDMVIDPLLSQHLLHFGIDIKSQTKTDKTMNELEIDYNINRWQYDQIQESGKQLKPTSGPGLTGLLNLGNSCYLNSVMQVIFSLPEFQKTYFNNANLMEVMNSGVERQKEIPFDFEIQTQKLAAGLLSGDYSREDAKKAGENRIPVPEPPGIRPSMFKLLVGRNHPEFSTNRQQDASDFLFHFFNLVEKSRPNPEANPCLTSFAFNFEERLQCLSSMAVDYKQRRDMQLSLPIPIAAAAGAGGVQSIGFSECVKAFLQPEIIDGFLSPVTQVRGQVQKTQRLKSLPRVLIVLLRRFAIDPASFRAIKIDAKVEMPQIWDVKDLLGSGPQPGETAMDTSSVPGRAVESQVSPNLESLAMLEAMGFESSIAKSALIATKNNEDLNVAVNWIMENPDGLIPSSNPVATNPGSANLVANPVAVSELVSMGLNEKHAAIALKHTDNNTERAVEWIFSHQEELEGGGFGDEGPREAPAGGEVGVCPEMGTEYELKGFISHMGSSCNVGHYVCHIQKPMTSGEKKWVIFNDEKVALSESPPFDCGFLYFYEKK